MENTNEFMVIDQSDVENLIYTIRGQKVMLDADLAKIYGYTTKAFNQQVKRNIERFPEDMMFQLNDDEIDNLRSQNVTTKLNSMSRSNPYAFTEQGVYMLMTVLKGELAVKQSIMLVRIFKGMKDYLTDNKMLISSDDFYKLATITAQNTSDIAKIKEEMVTKSELDKFIKSFNDKRIAKEYVILNGQTVEADLAYSEIYALAKKTIYVVDNYIGLKTLSLLKTAPAGVTAIIFSDNIRNMLRLTDYNDYVSEYGHPPVAFQKTNGKYHDRYIILDYNTRTEKIYHCGASSKDAGKKITSITKIEDRIIYHSMIDALLCNPTLVLI
ncbi:MAG: ORF6N domain-containing protein [Wujia sp.]